MKGHWVYMTVYYISIWFICTKKDNSLLCCRMLSLAVLITYLQALVSVAQAQLPTGHHGLLGAPVFTTDQTPALCPIRVRGQHLDTALIAGSSSCDSDLCGTKGWVRNHKAKCRCTKRRVFSCEQPLIMSKILQATSWKINTCFTTDDN